MDRISNLPTEIICHIGCFLSAKEAAFAMVLSKRWKNLFTIVPNLRFGSSVNNTKRFMTQKQKNKNKNNTKSFKDFVDGVLALPVTTRIRKFSVKWSFEDNEPARYDYINRCICHVLKLGVLDLELQIDVRERGYYSLPLEVLTCETIAKLTLGSGFVIDFLPVDAFLPSLKILCLDSIWFYEFGRCAFNTLLSASPELEELVIDGVEFERWKWSFTVSSPTLRRLTIRRKEWDSYDDLAHEFNTLSFDTPSLTYLEYADYVPKEYPIVNLDSLVEAKLELSAAEDRIWEKDLADDFDPMNLINGLKNVKILELGIHAMTMFEVFGEAIPVFENLFRVSLSLYDFCWFSLPTLLKKFPNLKTLIIDDSLHYDRDEQGYLCQCVSEYSFLLSCPVEVLKINEYEGTIEELEQMKHFLKKLSRLELVEVCAQVTGDKKVRVLTDLLMLPRASSDCKIQVEFS